MKKGYCIDNKGNWVELFDEQIYLVNRNLVELVLPENCTWCNCTNNKLTQLIVNSRCEYLYCYINKLTELILPENCTTCSCGNNQLTNLIVSKNCDLNCHSNNISHMIEQLLMSRDPIKIQLANNLQRIIKK